MAKICKISGNNNSRQMIFITHKELSEWTGDHYWSMRHKLAAFPLYVWKKVKGLFIRRIMLKKLEDPNIIVGVHWGFVIRNARSYNWVDFHLTDKDTATGLDRFETPKILLTSKDFIMPKESFSAAQSSFKWDLITVSHNSKRKRLLQLMKSIRKIKTLMPSFTCVLLVNTASKVGVRNSTHTEVEFLKYYYENFSYTERQDIVMLRISYELGLEGVSSNFVYWLMRNAKNFVLFSKAEGSAKVIKEAITFGAHVWLSKYLLGGSLQGLSTSNYTLFDDDEHFVRQFIDRCVVNNQRSLQKNFTLKSVNKLQEFLRQEKILRDDESLSMDDFKFADKWLPAHHPDQIKNGVTGDILSLTEIMRFFKKIKQ